MANSRDRSRSPTRTDGARTRPRDLLLSEEALQVSIGRTRQYLLAHLSGCRASSLEAEFPPDVYYTAAAVMSRLNGWDILIPPSGRVPQTLEMVARDAPACDWARLSSPDLMAREPCLVHARDPLSTALVALPDVWNLWPGGLAQSMQAVAGTGATEAPWEQAGIDHVSASPSNGRGTHGKREPLESIGTETTICTPSACSASFSPSAPPPPPLPPPPLPLPPPPPASSTSLRFELGCAVIVDEIRYK